MTTLLDQLQARRARIAERLAELDKAIEALRPYALKMPASAAPSGARTAGQAEMSERGDICTWCGGEGKVASPIAGAPHKVCPVCGGNGIEPNSLSNAASAALGSGSPTADSPRPAASVSDARTEPELPAELDVRNRA